MRRHAQHLNRVQVHHLGTPIAHDVWLCMSTCHEIHLQDELPNVVWDGECHHCESSHCQRRLLRGVDDAAPQAALLPDPRHGDAAAGSKGCCHRVGGVAALPLWVWCQPQRQCRVFTWQLPTAAR